MLFIISSCVAYVNSYALLIYQEPSVNLALQLLDGSPLRLGDKIPMSVTVAKFEQKGMMLGPQLFCRL